MVRNTNGGCKSKGFARKLQYAGSGSEPLRLPSEDGEVIGVVRRMLGNGRINVALSGADLPAEIQCVIRNKFRGRSKRNHLITVGSMVLIGLHTWEKPNYRHSDLLHIYSNSDISQLLHMKLIPNSFVSESSGGTTGIGGGMVVGDDLLTFEDRDDDDVVCDMPPAQKLPAGGGDLPDLGCSSSDEEMPDFDDI
jgi:translation initiation factor IF-1